MKANNNPLLPEIVVAISYKDIYSDYDTVNPEDFIKDIPTIPLLKFVVERFNKVLYVSPFDKRNLTMLREFNSKLPKDTRNKVFKLTKQQNDKLHIYSHEGVTLFTQLALQNYVPLKCEKDNYIAEDEYEKIFKALLYCNQIWTDNQLSSNEAKVLLIGHEQTIRQDGHQNLIEVCPLDQIADSMHNPHNTHFRRYLSLTNSCRWSPRCSHFHCNCGCPQRAEHIADTGVVHVTRLTLHRTSEDGPRLYISKNIIFLTVC